MIPRYTKEAIDRYFEQGYPVGDFLWGVLINDLYYAVCHADNNNRHALYDIVLYVQNYLPRCCYGNSQIVRGWLDAHKTDRKQKAFGKNPINIDSAMFQSLLIQGSSVIVSFNRRNRSE